MVNPDTIRTIAIYIPLLTASLSVLGSSAIVTSIWMEREKRLRKPQARIMLAMSIFDLCYSVNKFLTFLTYPSDMGVPTFGNQATCSMQGFFAQFCFATACYNIALCVYYYATICLGMSNVEFSRYIEKALHISIIVLHLSFSIVGVSIGLFNPQPVGCYVAPYPPGCSFRDSTIQCERFGDSYHALTEIFSQFWVQLGYVILIPLNVKIWLFVRKEEMAANEFMNRQYVAGRDRRMEVKTKYARQVFYQSMLYVGSFLITWTFLMVYQIYDWIVGYYIPWAGLLVNIFVPTQGFWNALVYARPRYLRIKERESDLSILAIFLMVFFPPLSRQTRRNIELEKRRDHSTDELDDVS